MTMFPPPFDDRMKTDMSALFARVAVLEKQMAVAAGAYAALVCTSTTRPSSPVVGCLVFETDTSKLGVWNGSAWVRTAALT